MQKNMEKQISEATKKNWDRLGKDFTNTSLTKRANKRLSKKTIIPDEYLSESDKKLSLSILKQLDNIKDSIENKINHLIVEYLIAYNLVSKDLKDFKNEYIKDFIISLNLTKKKYNLNFSYKPSGDLLGYIYQLLLKEGDKNIIGSYYTPGWIVDDMLRDISFDNKTICDPCCGTGGFLNVVAKGYSIKPNNIFGYDIDKTATNITKANLFVTFSNYDFAPNIYNKDFLLDKDNKKYDLIVTNPPWGAKVRDYNINRFKNLKETFSYFLIKSIEKIKENGIIRFLLPISILNVKKHNIIRKYLLDNTKIEKICIYKKVFSGVLTDVIGLILQKIKQTNYQVEIEKKDMKYKIDITRYQKDKNNVFSLYDENISRVIEKIKLSKSSLLNDAIFALGIVTGDNNKLLKEIKQKGLEPIYTGKEVKKYFLDKPKKFIKFDKQAFQQCANIDYYRACDKLIYKFISSNLLFSYDDKKVISLNSANILIANKNKISNKALCLLLNSNVMNFYYKNVVFENKVLKHNILSLPIVNISEDENKHLEEMFENLKISSSDKQIQERIYKLYNLEQADIDIIEEYLYNGRVNKNIKATKRKI